jgi:hypothetical protein
LRRAAPILHASGVNDGAQHYALRIDRRVNLAALHLLAGVVAGQAVMTGPFSAGFSDS